MAVLPVVYENGQHRTGSMSELLMVSQSCGNMLSFGADGGLFVDGNAILSNGETSNLLLISATDQKIYLSVDNLVKAGFSLGGAGSISSEAGNLLTVDSQGKYLVSASSIESAITGHGYVTSTELTNALAPYATTSALSSALTSALEPYVTKTALADALSSVSVSPASMRSDTDTNLITVSQADGKLLLTAQQLLDQGFAMSDTSGGGIDISALNSIISATPNNAIVLGTDNLLYVPTDCGEL